MLGPGMQVYFPCSMRLVSVNERHRSYDIKGKTSCFDYDWPSGLVLDRHYTCSACGNMGSGPRFKCADDQDIEIHVQCGKLPKTAKHVTHRHVLTLTTDTDQIENEDDEFICDACEEMRNPEYWVYHCPVAECDIRVHINCAIVPTAAQDNWSRRVVCFATYSPLYDHSYMLSYLELLNRATLNKLSKEFGKVIGREEKRKDKVEFVHFDHKHPLKPYDEPFKQHEGGLCPICKTPIYGKMFGCKDCDYFIHKWCANLQQKIQHLSHEHQLTLESSNAHRWKCGLCDSSRGLGMSYTCKECDFHLEVLCAALPENLNHKLHEHTFAPLRTTLDQSLFTYFGEKFAKRLGDLPRCNACGFPCQDLTLECRKCNLHLHIHCFLLPVTGKHPSHRHELLLSLPPDRVDSNENLDDFLCDVCKEKRDPENWVYRCPKCDYLVAAHVNCAASPKLVATSMAIDELQRKIEDFQLGNDSIKFEDILIESSDEDILIESSDEDI